MKQPWTSSGLLNVEIQKEHEIHQNAQSSQIWGLQQVFQSSQFKSYVQLMLLWLLSYQLWTNL
ncbi:hypothetical protein PsorP6_016195 [Peronosclerospora sorghi]|uniref:Uncharacterized protein n=2 Tax=Peronosclerospora sorghi TaxID=230839 RepID=A0ACC0VLV0_9STRA|nr:hypothetical protein PsorP6_016190 [Peronosclerospora sorghi]KAI9907465.1 hypothetical protein PsorP6_016195 [Peronosclerospora sorghi]